MARTPWGMHHRQLNMTKAQQSGTSRVQMDLQMNQLGSALHCPRYERYFGTIYLYKSKYMPRQGQPISYDWCTKKGGGSWEIIPDWLFFLVEKDNGCIKGRPIVKGIYQYMFIQPETNTGGQWPLFLIPIPIVLKIPVHVRCPKTE